MTNPPNQLSESGEHRSNIFCARVQGEVHLGKACTADPAHQAAVSQRPSLALTLTTCLGILSLGILSLGTPANAATFLWDILSAGDGNGVVDDGTGTWDTTTRNWTQDTGTTNVVDATNGDFDDQIFGTGTAGAAGTVTLGTSFSTGSVTFNAANGGGAYTLDLSGNTLTLLRSTSAIVANSDATITGGTIELEGGNSAIAVNNGSTMTISSVIADRGTGPDILGVSGTGSGGDTLILSGDNTITGELSINRTTVSVGTIGAKSTASNAGAGTEVVLRDFATLIYTGDGTEGATDRDIRLEGNAALGAEPTISNNGTGALNWSSGTFTNNRGANPTTLVLGGSYTGSANTLGVTLVDSASGTLSLQKDDASTWILTGTNTYTGNTTINAGTLEIGSAGQLGSGTYAGTIANDGILNYNSSATQTLNGVISGSGSLVLNGSGQLNLSVNNSFSGGVTVNNGTLGLEFSAIDGGPLTVNGGLVSGSIHDSFDNISVSELSGSGGLIEASRRTFTVTQATNTTYAGVIQDLNGIVSNGNGTVFTKAGSRHADPLRGQHLLQNHQRQCWHPRGEWCPLQRRD